VARQDRSVSLPVVDERPAIRRSRMGRWRAGVLILVHVIFAIHIAQWLIMGMTISPVEPSESMETLEHGVVNAGFVFFLLAIASTLVFGRFFCGWACHVVALQDLCGHLMRRARIRPKPFRSRLLVFAPLGFGLYMFVWPTFKRLALKPALHALDVEWPRWLAESPDPHGLTAGFVVPDFWATFPAWYVAIPFLLICGFATVYFLGSKGFCTYGCPYGGLFAPADKVAPVRIRVTDACQHCGHCTATCTSNVRVHEEVRDFGMVVDPGCMKCMDCVSVCPNDALYVGLGKPSILAGPRSEEAKRTHAEATRARRRRYDMTWPEEVAFGLLFVLLFLAFRSMLDLVPMLMAIGMAGVATFLLHAAWRTITSPNARIHGFQLKLKGAMRPAGVVAVGAGVVILGTAAWSGHARWHRWSANLAYKGIDVPIAVAMRPDFVPTERERSLARRGVGHAARADSVARGGLGWRLDPDADLRLAYMHLIDADLDRAEKALRRVVEEGRPRDPVVLQLSQIMIARGADGAEVEAMLARSLELHPDLHTVRDRLARGLAGRGEVDEATTLHEAALAEHPDDPDVALDAARFFQAAGRHEDARAALEGAERLARADDRDALLVDVATVSASVRRRSSARRSARWISASTTGFGAWRYSWPSMSRPGRCASFPASVAIRRRPAPSSRGPHVSSCWSASARRRTR